MIIEKDFKDSEIFDIGVLHTELVKGHKDCAGSGLAFVDDNKVVDCECESVFNYLKELIYANIPKGFWGVPVNSAYDYGFFLDNNQLPESSYHIVGVPGGGKTALMSLLGKLAIFKGKSVFYITAENILRLSRSDDSLVDRMCGASIILIDALDKYNRSNWADGQIEYVLRNLADKGKIIYVATSALDEELKSEVGKGIYEFLGIHLSLQVGIEYTKKLKSLRVVDYFDKSFVKEAVENFQNVLESTEVV